MGLLTGRSRKQYDPFKGRSGDLQLIEQHETLFATFDDSVASGVGSQTILQVPSGYYARIVGVTYFFDVGGSGVTYGYILVDSNKFIVLPLDVASVSELVEYEFEQAPRASNNVQLQYNTPSGGTFTVTLRYVLEPTSRGYLVNT